MFKNIIGLLISISLVFSQLFVFSAHAQEFTVSGNGNGSSNNISYQNNDSNTINQNNNAEIDNDVDADASTGNNQANDNTGDVEIQTGDANVSTKIENSGNTSTAVVDCCPDDDPGSVTIEDNGSDSDNTVNITQTSGNQITVNNNLNLRNNVSLNANTGDNDANDNGGDVVIETGEINLLAMVLNQNLNSSYVSASNKNPSFNYRISGNGTGSVNSINEDFDDRSEYTVFNNLFLVNNINNTSNTGSNSANRNNGKVFISTGNIYLDIILQNKDINVSKIIASCCQKSPTPTPTPTPSGSPSGSPTPTPSPTPGSSCCSPTTDVPGPGGGSGGPSGGGSGGGGGEVLGATLPATGGASLWMLTALALLMLASGVILRADAKFQPKKVFGEFSYSFRSYALGVYLFTNLKSLPPYKA